MYPLEKALMQHHLIVLRVLGEWWELDLIGKDKAECAHAVAEALSQIELEQELPYLQIDELEGIKKLVAAEGRLPVSRFEREFGEVRMMGPARLEREEPWLNPSSAAEALWYRGLIYRAFDETETGLVEFYFVPTELFELLLEQPLILREGSAESDSNYTTATSLHPIDPPTQLISSTENFLNDFITLLACTQRTPLSAENKQLLQPYLFTADENWIDLLSTIALEDELLRETEQGLRPTKAALEWVKLPRHEQWVALWDGWLKTEWSELHHLPSLVCEGSWQDDPTRARKTILNYLPHDHWSDLDELIVLIKQKSPDFLRPDGNFDTWYIREGETGRYLRGFEHWGDVEGALLKQLLGRWLGWLGIIELDVEGKIGRMTPRAIAWRNHTMLEDGDALPIIVQPDATILVSPQASGYARFQLARVAEMQAVETDKPYQFRITPNSLTHAQQQGIKPQRVLQFLTEISEGRKLPTTTLRAIERWAEHGTEGMLKSVVILQVKSGAVLDTLFRNEKTRPYMGARLGEMTATVPTEQWRTLQKMTAQLGLLLEVDGNSSMP